MLARDHVDLVFDGLDTFADVAVNGVVLATAANAHRRWRVAAKRALRLGANSVTVRFASPIRRLQPMVLATKHPLPGEYDSMFGDEPAGRQTSPYIRKPKYHYGWDWGPRIVTLGIWRAARIEAWDAARIETLRVRQLAVHDAEARLSADLEVIAGAAASAAVAVTITAPDGGVTTTTQRVALVAGTNAIAVPVSIPDPQRWQPVGYGAQPLYTVTAALAGMDSATRRTGLRTVELRRPVDLWGRGFELHVNGIPIFMKGANLIPFDSLPDRVTPARIGAVLRAARDANMNMLRVWGGGYYLDDAFYDQADAMGLMVWQDFMFGGAVTPPDAAFRDTVRVEAAEQVARLQAHPSIVIWAGNNEVLSGWETWSDRIAFKIAVGAAEQERIGTAMAILFDGVLRAVVAAGDDDVPYWPGSPSANYEGPPDVDSDGDRHYWSVWGGKLPIEAYLANTPRFMSEYGLQSLPDLKTIRTFAAPADLTIASPVIKAHQKFLKGEGNDRLLLYITQRYRAPRDFAELVYLSQTMQAEGVELAALHHRASRPRTMGSLYWQLNDVWPGASWSSVDHYGRWKALNFRARRFYAPRAIAALRSDGVTRVSVISDRVAPGVLRWRLRVIDADGSVSSTREGAVTAAPLAATEIVRVDDANLFADPARDVAVAELIDGEAVISRSLVTALPPKDMVLPDPRIAIAWDGTAVTLTATRLARAVWIDLGGFDAELSDNAFDLLPGESVTIQSRSATPLARLKRALTVRTLYGPVAR
jgi:beta-mannosidase